MKKDTKARTFVFCLHSINSLLDSLCIVTTCVCRNKSKHTANQNLKTGRTTIKCTLTHERISNGKGKVRPRTGQDRQWRYSCTLSLTSRPGRFAPGKDTRNSLYRGLGGPQGRYERVRKISSPTRIFLILLYSSLTTHKTNIYAPGEIRTRNPSKRSAADPSL